MSRVRIGIIGSQGRMGKALTTAAIENENADIVGATEMVGNPYIGEKLKDPKTGDTLDVTITTDTEDLIKDADVVLDFTCPTATVNHAMLASKYGTNLVIGTTGLNNDDEAKLKTASEKTAIVYASNYSAGVNILNHLVRIAAASLDDDFDIEIVEMHHRHKVDAPSGTALSLGAAAAAGRGQNLNDIMISGRDGITGERKKGDIGFAALRGGNVAGDHTISFNADDERIELSHKAGDRMIFARGAVKAAIWVGGKPAGLYNMSDVLGLN